METGAPDRGRAGALVVRDDLRVDNIIQRNYKRDIESRVGTKQIVNPETGAGMGFQCKETGVVLHERRRIWTTSTGRNR